MFNEVFPEDLRDLAVAPMEEKGTTGLKYYGGTVYEEMELKLRGTRGIQTYNEMVLNDPIVGGVLYSIEALLLNAPWRVQSASKKAKDQKNADFVQSCLEDMSFSWKESLRQFFTFLKYGFAVCEICYKYRRGYNDDEDKSSEYNDGRIGWSKIPLRAQRSILDGRWYLDKNGNILGVQQWAMDQDVLADIPFQKMLLFRTTTVNNNPEGVSLLRSAWWPYYMKKNMEKIEAIGIERNLSGVPVIGAPAKIMSANAEPAETQLYNQLKNIVTNLRRDEMAGIVMPRAYDNNNNAMFSLELLTANSAGAPDTTKPIQRYASEIAMSMLADFLMLGQSSSGTQALASEKIDIFTTALHSWLGIVAGQFNQYAIPRLLRANGITGPTPILVPGDVTSKGLSDFIANLRNLAVSGLNLFPDNVLENYIRGRMQLPEISPEDAEERDSRAQGYTEVKNNPDGVIPKGETGGAAQVTRPKKPRLKNRELSTNSNKRNGISD